MASVAHRGRGFYDGVRWAMLASLALGMVLRSLAADAVSKAYGATGVSLPLYGSDKSSPAAVAYFSELRVGAQRRGFLRVGVLPLIEGYEVEIRFKRPEAEALGDLPAALRALTHGDSAELHHLRIFGPAGEKPILEAGLAVLEADGEWQLSDVVTDRGLTLATARLGASGARAGRVAGFSDGARLKFRIFPDPR